MSLRQKYQRILAGFAPAGAIGMSLLLGSTVPSAASEHPAGLQPSASGADSVSDRLAAIREAVSAVASTDQKSAPGTGETRMAWGNWFHPYGWGNYGWPNWNNWHNWNNWGNFWHNW